MPESSQENPGNARLAGLEKDLGMTGSDYNVVLSIFYISYIVFEIPATVACKSIGPGYVHSMESARKHPY